MSLLKILRYPDKQLRQQAHTVTQFDENLAHTISSLFNTLYHANGWGLAANQVGILSQIIVMDISPDQNQPMYFINPTIIAKEGEIGSEEDNLSFPGMYITIKRAKKIELQFQDKSGNLQTQIFEGLLACCIQQKVDSLQGTLFIDHLSSLKRTRLLDKYKKMKFKPGTHDHGHDHHSHHSHDDHVHGPGCNH